MLCIVCQSNLDFAHLDFGLKFDFGFSLDLRLLHITFNLDFVILDFTLNLYIAIHDFKLNLDIATLGFTWNIDFANLDFAFSCWPQVSQNWDFIHCIFMKQKRLSFMFLNLSWWQKQISKVRFRYTSLMLNYSIWTVKHAYMTQFEFTVKSHL